jgi:hypothetical protein
LAYDANSILDDGRPDWILSRPFQRNFLWQIHAKMAELIELKEKSGGKTDISDISKYPSLPPLLAS